MLFFVFKKTENDLHKRVIFNLRETKNFMNTRINPLFVAQHNLSRVLLSTPMRDRGEVIRGVVNKVKCHRAETKKISANFCDNEIDLYKKFLFAPQASNKKLANLVLRFSCIYFNREPIKSCLQFFDKNLTHLRKLTLRFNSTCAVNNNELIKLGKLLSRCSHLDTLKLELTFFKDINVAGFKGLFAQLKKLAGLQTLMLNCAQITPLDRKAALNIVADTLTTFTKLHTLYLNFDALVKLNQHDDKDIDDGAVRKLITKLREIKLTHLSLYLRNNNITDDVLSALAHYTEEQKLTCIHYQVESKHLPHKAKIKFAHWQERYMVSVMCKAAGKINTLKNQDAI